MKSPCVFTVVAALAMSGGVAAQTRTEGRFHTGALSWTPTLTLRDAGFDTNVFEEAVSPKRDQVAVFSPQVDGLLRLAAADVRFGGTADFVYFQRYTTERSINTRSNVGFDLRGWRVRPFGRGSFLDSRERVNSEIDVRARRSDREVSGGLGIQVTPRGVLEVAGRFGQSTFRQGEMFRGVDLAQRLNRETVGTNVRFVYDVTPLTRLLLEGAGSQDRFTLSPAYDADSMRIGAGFRFEPDALVNGHAIIGYRRIDPVGERAFGYEGITVAVDLGTSCFSGRDSTSRSPAIPATRSRRNRTFSRPATAARFCTTWSAPSMSRRSSRGKRSTTRGSRDSMVRNCRRTALRSPSTAAVSRSGPASAFV